MKTLKAEDLSSFTGSELWYQHGLVPSITYTDGVRYMAETGEAYWLIDEIALAQRYEKKVKAEEFQVWTLTVTEHTATLTCDDGNNNIVFAKHIQYTDFPLPEIKLYCTDNVILLPSEY
jgi:hypothetical protein